MPKEPLELRRYILECIKQEIWFKETEESTFQLPDWLFWPLDKGEAEKTGRWHMGTSLVNRAIRETQMALNLLALVCENPIERALKQNLIGIENTPSYEKIKALNPILITTITACALEKFWRDAFEFHYGDIINQQMHEFAQNTKDTAHYESFGVKERLVYPPERLKPSSSLKDPVYEVVTTWEKGKRKLEISLLQTKPCTFGIKLTIDGTIYPLDVTYLDIDHPENVINLTPKEMPLLHE